MRLVLFGVALAAIAVPTGARTRNDAQIWSDFLLSKPVHTGVLLSGEIVNRIVDDAAREGQVETRLQVGHPFSRTVTGWVGWVHFTTYAALGRNGIENHAVEQLNWTPGRIGRVAVALRTRLEQRAIRGVGATNWRIREQLRLTMPLHPGGPALVAWGEPFLALNRTRAQPYRLELSRAFAGVTVPLAKHLDLEAGYLNEYLPRPAGDRDNHALSTTLSLRL